jgi:hypothetical protein
MDPPLLSTAAKSHHGGRREGRHARQGGESHGTADARPEHQCGPIGRRQGFEPKTHGSLHARTIEPCARRPFTTLEISKRPRGTDLAVDLQGVILGREEGV